MKLFQITAFPEKVNFECEFCNYKTESERGLKVHVTRKHENLSEKPFPRTCDFCEATVYDQSYLETHLKEHTYKKLEYKCENCDFLFHDMLSLDLHVGRKHSGKFECAICDYEGKNKEDLNTHLHTCETFTCDYCFPRIKV